MRGQGALEKSLLLGDKWRIWVKMCCRRIDIDIAHIRNVIAKMRSHDTDEFSRELDLIKKLRERLEEIEGRLDGLERKIER